MKKGKIYRTEFKLVVLSNEPITGLPLDHILNECDEGEFKLGETVEKERILKGKKAVKEIEKYDQDLDFFWMDEEGNMNVDPEDFM